ncbi:hypothetical protein YB2330_006437 [Saitoella coloradoensis]
MTRERRLQLRDGARSNFFHGFDGYMTHAFPADELNPIACAPRGRNLRDPNDLGVNDVCGGFALTLIDSLPTLALMNRTRFEEGVRRVLDSLGEEGFDLDVRVQVFEVTIRVLGGLLSAHQEAQNQHLDWYNNELVHLAHDLGTRLLPAFETPTGIPWPRINLRNGLALHVTEKESSTNNAAGAGSLILEFTLLSRLTGDERFEFVARRAFFAIWDRRIRTRRGSELGVVGNEIDAWTGEWGSYITGLGAGVDSLYEYAVKAHILTGDEAYIRVWDESYAALRLYSADSGGWVWKNFHVVHGWVATFWIDSLAAYFPGLLTLVGEVKAAEKMWLVYWGLWRRYAAIPERWDWRRREVEVQVEHYPLRPEFVESTYHLWRATGDEYYLSVGEVIVMDLERRCRTRCGWAGLQRVEDIIKGGQGKEANWQDRMESFALSETWKYLFLMFDEENPLHMGDAPWVFTTEGHHIYVPSHLRKLNPSMSSARAPATNVTMKRVCEKPAREKFWSGVASRTDLHFPAMLTGADLFVSHVRGVMFPPTPEGVCSTAIPYAEQYEVLFGKKSFEEVTSDRAGFADMAVKVVKEMGRVIVRDLEGIVMRFATTSKGDGVVVVRVNDIVIEEGERVVIEDLGQAIEFMPVDYFRGEFVPGTVLRIGATWKIEDSLEGQEGSYIITERAYRVPWSSDPTQTKWPVMYRAPPTNLAACRALKSVRPIPGWDRGAAIVVRMSGGCSLVAKAVHAGKAGYSLLVVTQGHEETDGKLLLAEEGEVKRAERQLAESGKKLPAVVVISNALDTMLDADESTGGWQFKQENTAEIMQEPGAKIEGRLMAHGGRDRSVPVNVEGEPRLRGAVWFRGLKVENLVLNTGYEI